MSQYPLIFRVQQKFDNPYLDDVPGAVESELSALSLDRKIKPGQTVAITVGSRGISDIRSIIQTVVVHLKRLGAEPFIVPAMGSHGGGTAEGQQKVLESYGVTPTECGCPIRSSMETVIVCEAAEGFPVHIDKHACGADHVLVCNRIKSHTLFTGDIESGLMKMMLIGLGKHAGARIYHRVIREYNFGQIVRSVAQEVLVRCSVVAGLAIVENSYGQTAMVEAIEPEKIQEREKSLLVESKQWMPRLPFKTADVLLIDEIGKNISGAGIDVNVVGRKYLLHKSAENEWPKIRAIAVRGLSPASHGNAIGIGFVELCRTRVLEKMDVHSTRINALTGGNFAEVMLPLDYGTDREMFDVMLTQVVGMTEPCDAKMMWIRNTLKVSEVECSVAYLDEARSRDDLEIVSDPRPFPLDADGNLCDEHMNGLEP